MAPDGVLTQRSLNGRDYALAMGGQDVEVAVIGGGVVGCAVAHALARRGVAATVLEAERALALGASGTNSGILHTGFDSTPGELETRLILRSAELRETLLDELGVPLLRCGALLVAHDEDEREAVARLADNAAGNGVEAGLRPDGSLLVPGESVTDPVAFVAALAGAARAGGATVRVDSRVVALGAVEGHDGGGLSLTLHDGERIGARAVVNCAGLFADEVAALAGEAPVSIYPRKGEFVVFAPREPLRRILLPVPSALGKGVLVFPTIDGVAIAGPTAREREDKRDWSVEPDAAQLIRARGTRLYPALADAELLECYAGLRPAGRNASYVIERSRTLAGLIHVAAIRSTGLSASLGIGEHVCELLAEHAGVELSPVRALATPHADATASLAGEQPWWRRAARRAEVGG
jgi:glycerol-3-phosphate dehydrogenase